MGNDFSFAVSGSSGTLSYNNGGHYTASVRIRDVKYNYGVASDESHARTERAFYPHRRIPGQFAITIDCIKYAEYKQLMTWLNNYADALLTGSQADNAAISIMNVNVPSRNFTRLGILTTGIDDHDQTGSMVFSPELVFLTLSDPKDTAIPLIQPSGGSTFSGPQINAAETLAFYPVGTYQYKDAVLYDDPGAGTPSITSSLPASASLQDVINVILNTPPATQASGQVNAIGQVGGGR